MAMHKKTKKLIAYIARHPDASTKQIAKACGTTASAVTNAKWRYKSDIAREANRMQSQLLYTLSQGKGKHRMKGSSNEMHPAVPAEDQMELDLADYPMVADHIPIEELRNVAADDKFSVDRLLDQRGEKYATYGTFEDLAEVSQRFKDSLQYFLITRNKYIAPDQQESMEMIFHKFARIINGDADYVDNWKDIAGYATLVADRLEGRAR